MLKGTLDDFTLPDIFRLLSQSNKTGRLEVQRSAGQGNVFFRHGDVYFAESTLSRELIGQKLVKAKVLTDGQLIKALDEQAESGGRLGEVLLSSGLVSDEQLEAALRSQIEDAVFDLLRWEAGEFDWAPDEETEAEVALSVSVENLIMEGSRRLDTLAIITRKIPSENAVVAMAPAPPEGAAEINITPDEWRVLVLVNGQRTVLDIAEAVSADVFATMRTLYGLAAAGLIHVPGFEAEDDAEPLPELPPERDVLVAEAPEPEAPAPVAEAASVFEEVVAEEPVASEEPAADEPASPVAEETPDESPVVANAESENAYHLSAYDPEVMVDENAIDDVLSDVAAEEPTEGISVAEEAQEDESLSATDLPTGDWFDPPQPGDIMAEGPAEEVAAEDPFASEILAPEASSDDDSELSPFVEVTSEPASELSPFVEVSSEPAAGEIDVETVSDTAGYSGSDRTVDKRAAVQELSDLFRQSEVENNPTFLVPPVEPREEEEPEAVLDDLPDPENKHRVEDDEEITRGLITRLIDGVKGL